MSRILARKARQKRVIDDQTSPLFPELEEPHTAPVFPKPGTREADVLEALLTRALTVPQWDKEGNGWRLTATAGALAKKGWVIESTLIPADGCRRSIAKYRLDRDHPINKLALKGKKR